MDILQYLKGKKEQREGQKKHPVAERSSSFRYLYALGLGVMAMGNMKAITEVREYYEQLIDRIGISQDEYVKIVGDINNNFDNKLKDIVKNLVTKQDKYQFVADLYLIYAKTLWAQEYCRQVLRNYTQMLALSEIEQQFFHHFYEYASKKQEKEAFRCYREFVADGYEVSYPLLVYMFPGFSLEETCADLVVEVGKTLVLDRPITVQGNILVKQGGSLLIRGAALKISGSIQVEGGRIHMQHSYVEANGAKRDYLLYVQRTAVAAVENSQINCGGHCGFVRQDKGQLIIKDSTVSQTAGESAVTFSGNYAVIEGTGFDTCKAGGIAIYDMAGLEMRSCIFIHCHRDYGGAVYSEGISDVKIEECEFQSCQAKYLGAAIYFKYEKFGQRIKNCRINACVPEDTAVFNSYADDIDISMP